MKVNTLQFMNLVFADGILTAVQTLASTGLCGIIHSFIGGHPLLILGVVEPTIVMYTFMFNFAKNQKNLGPHLFLAWAGWYTSLSKLMLCSRKISYVYEPEPELDTIPFSRNKLLKGESFNCWVCS